MFARSAMRTRRGIFSAMAVAAVLGLSFLIVMGWQCLPSAQAQKPGGSMPTPKVGRMILASGVEQPPAKIIVDPPKPDLLAQGVAFLQFRTDNLQMLPVFGPAAAVVSPRIGHLHMTLDDAPWHWAHTSNDPVIVAVLSPGPHKIVFELVDANHKVLAQEVVRFDVPRQ